MKVLRFLAIISVLALTSASFSAQNIPQRDYKFQPIYIKPDMQQIAKSLYARVFTAEKIDDQKIKAEYTELSPSKKRAVINMMLALGHPAVSPQVSVRIRTSELKKLTQLLKDTDDELVAAQHAQEKADFEAKQASVAVHAVSQQVAPAQQPSQQIPAAAQPAAAGQPAEGGWFGGVYDWWYSQPAK